MEDTDSETLLVGAVLPSDPSESTQFWTSVLPGIQAIIRRQCVRAGLSPDDANDFIQDAVQRALAWIDREKDARITVEWVYTVAHNRLHDFLRQRSRQARNNFPNSAEQPHTTQSIPQADAEARALRAYNNLAASDREIVDLLLLKELPADQAASHLQTTKWTVYKRYERALKRMRDLYHGQS